jgi:hypothetical protein
VPSRTKRGAGLFILVCGGATTERVRANVIARSDDSATTTDVDVNAVGAMDVSRSEAKRAQTNVIARSDDRATTTDVDVNAVRAMDVSRSEAKRAQTNVIARSDDRATTTDIVDNRCAKRHNPLRKGLQSSAQRTPILCAKDSNPLRKGLPFFTQVVARSSLRAITFAPKLRCAPF